MHKQDGIYHLDGGKVGLGAAAIPVENSAHVLCELGNTLGPLLLAIH